MPGKHNRNIMDLRFSTGFSEIRLADAPDSLHLHRLDQANTGFSERLDSDITMMLY